MYVFHRKLKSRRFTSMQCFFVWWKHTLENSYRVRLLTVSFPTISAGLVLFSMRAASQKFIIFQIKETSMQISYEISAVWTWNGQRFCLRHFPQRIKCGTSCTFPNQVSNAFSTKVIPTWMHSVCAVLLCFTWIYIILRGVSKYTVNEFL